jgi:hypothetical protein
LASDFGGRLETGWPAGRTGVASVRGLLGGDGGRTGVVVGKEGRRLLADPTAERLDPARWRHTRARDGGSGSGSSSEGAAHAPARASDPCGRRRIASASAAVARSCRFHRSTRPRSRRRRRWRHSLCSLKQLTEDVFWVSFYPSHHNSSNLKNYYYNSVILKYAITIVGLSDYYHFLRILAARTHCQTPDTYIEGVWTPVRLRR